MKSHDLKVTKFVINKNSKEAHINRKKQYTLAPQKLVAAFLS